MIVELKPQLDDSERAAVDRFHSRSARSHIWQQPCAAALHLQDGRQVLHVLGTHEGVVTCHGILYVDRWRREAFCMRGPVFDDTDVARDVVQFLCDECEKRGIGQLRVSPYWSGPDAQTMVSTLSGLGFRPYYAKEGPYTKTGRVALDDGIEKLFRTFSRETNQCARGGFQISRIVDFDRAREGHMLTERLAARRQLSSASLAWFDTLFTALLSDEKHGAMFGAYRDGRLVGTCWFVKANQAGALPVKYAIDNDFMRATARSLTIGIPIWCEGMKWAKKQGCEWFDMEGYDENTDRSSVIYQIHQFKHRFHPDPVDIVAEHVKICNRARYGLYRTQKLWKKVRISARGFSPSHFSFRR